MRQQIVVSSHADPTPANAYWVRHQIHLDRGKLDAALGDLEKITETFRGHFGAWLSKARILMLQGMKNSTYSTGVYYCAPLKIYQANTSRR